MSVCATRSMRQLAVGSFIAAAGMALAPHAHAIDLNTLDTFQDQSVQNWLGGTSITNKPGGRGGAADRYVQVDSNGNASGAGSRLAFHNSDARWIGDFAAAGVTGVQFDAANFGPLGVELRVVLFSSGSRWTSVQSVALPAGSAWQTITIPINQAALTRVLGTNPWPDSITNVSQFMIRHDPGSASSGGAAIDATIGFDNIRVVPTPGAASMLVGVGLLVGRRRRPVR